tara:strand:+ start:318 stop:833 length:516 start_codon:yes stop_codon:yes gene_type:complete
MEYIRNENNLNEPRAITGDNYAGINLVLVSSTDYRHVTKGDIFDGRLGETWRIDGGNPPHKPASSGRAYATDLAANIQSSRSFFPNVFGMEWAPVASDGMPDWIWSSTPEQKLALGRQYLRYVADTPPWQLLNYGPWLDDCTALIPFCDGAIQIDLGHIKLAVETDGHTHS